MPSTTSARPLDDLRRDLGWILDQLSALADRVSLIAGPGTASHDPKARAADPTLQALICAAHETQFVLDDLSIDSASAA